ncbi:unnamed protein product [Linum trigynum]|uniref:Uncharacterized protein n=1 Tax=Linum trigynum TaxID=586398 RepID=A0AAV2EWE6_9ROSI
MVQTKSMTAAEKVVAQEKAAQSKTSGSLVDGALEDLTDTEVLRRKVDQMEVTMGDLDAQTASLRTGQDALSLEFQAIREILEQLVHDKVKPATLASEESSAAR